MGVGEAAEAAEAADAADADAVGGAADTAVSGVAETVVPGASLDAWNEAWPSLLIIVKGAAYAAWRTPPFVRTLLAARSTPLRVYVLGDAAGLAHGHGRGVWAGNLGA